jgi:hypothetical protein
LRGSSRANSEAPNPNEEDEEGARLQNYVLDRCANLPGADVGSNPSDARCQAGKGDRGNHRSDRVASKGTVEKSAVFDQQQHCAGGKVWIYCISQNHRYAHSGCRDDEGNPSVVGRDDLGLANEQLSVMPCANRFLQTPLDMPPEVVRIEMIDAAVHEAEAVGGTDNRFAVDVEN